MKVSMKLSEYGEVVLYLRPETEAERIMLQAAQSQKGNVRTELTSIDEMVILFWKDGY